MNAKHKRTLEYFRQMSIPIDEVALAEYSAYEKDKLESLAERMHYLYGKINSNEVPNTKISFLKKEFSSLEWVFYQFNIIQQNAKKTFL